MTEIVTTMSLPGGQVARIITVPASGQSQASIDVDVAAGVELLTHLTAAGVTGWKSAYRTVGSWRLAWAVEQGPPPWRWPKVRGRLPRRGVQVTVGWRSTALHLFALRR